MIKYFGLVILLISFGTSAQTSPVATHLEVMMQSLFDAGKPAVNCDEKSDQGECSFAQVCSKLATNRNSLSVYENAAGEKLPNIAAQQIANLIFQCSASNGVYAPKPVEKPQIDQQAFQRWLVEQSPQTQVNYNKIMLHMADSAMQGASMGGGLGGGMGGLAPLEDFAKAEYYSRRMLASVEALKIEQTDEVKELVKQWSESQQKMFESMSAFGSPYSGGYGGGMGMGMGAIDWEKVPAQLREVLDDPFQTPSVIFDQTARGQKAREKYEIKGRQIQALVEQTRGHVKTVLEKQAAKYPDRKDNLEELQKRVSTVKFELVSSQQEVNTVCVTPNAFYDGMSHTLKICPQMMAMPEAHLRMVIAHEIGHSIDPCAAACPLHQLKNGSMTQYSILDLPTLYGSDHEKNPPKAMPIPFKDNPYSEVLTCLEGKDSVMARKADGAQMKKLLENQIRLTEEAGQDASGIKQFLAAVPEIEKYYGGCSVLPGNSRQQEAFSDWLAAEALVVSNIPINLTEVGGIFFVSDCPGLAPDISPALMQQLQQYNCLPQQDPQAAFAQVLPEAYQIGQTFGQLQQMDAGSHPPAVDRIQRLFRLQPQLKNRLGCKGEAFIGKYCEP